MNKVYLLLGGNVGDRKQYLKSCASRIEAKCGSIVSASSYYETEPWGKRDQPLFLNQAILLLTDMHAGQLIDSLLTIETEMGRKRMERYAQRVIDIDILFFNDQVINLPLLTVPHPEISRRRFALEPLHEIAAELVHPVLNKSIAQLLSECGDKLAVKKL